MGEMKRCAACGKENPVNEMKVCMHHQMHRYVCDSKCMTDFYNPPKKPTAAELEAKVATLESENAKIRAELERRVDGWKLVPVEPTQDIRGAIDLLCDDHRAFDDSDAFWHYLLDSAPSAPKADDPVKVQLLEALEGVVKRCSKEHGGAGYVGNDGQYLKVIDAAIAAAPQEGGKV